MSRWPWSTTAGPVLAGSLAGLVTTTFPAASCRAGSPRRRAWASTYWAAWASCFEQWGMAARAKKCFHSAAGFSPGILVFIPYLLMAYLSFTHWIVQST